MIRKLTIENFFSISEEQTFDLEIARNATDPDGRFATPISDSDQRFPKVAVIFGANASGKTNVLRAIAFLFNFVRNSAQAPPNSLIEVLPFFGEQNRNSITRFSVELDGALFDRNKRIRFVYDLEVTSDGKSVVREGLKYYPIGKSRNLFQRVKNDVKAGADFQLPGRDPVRKKIRENASLISILAQFGHEISSRIYDGLAAVQTNVTVLGKTDYPEGAATNYYSSSKEALDRLNAEIGKLDLGLEKVTLTSDQNGTRPIFHHKGLDRVLHFAFESQGTQRFYREYPKLHYVLSNGGVAVLDELDNDIHPLLLPEIIRLFQGDKTNPNNAQLIMSCHNATLLEHLTKEEIYFTEKDASGRTEIYGLKEVQGVRRDTNIYAKYLAGVYGAVPRVA